MAVQDSEAAYYQGVEDFFVARRGDPLFLSNPDWLLIRRWRQEGVPLRVVLRGIADALESHQRAWGRRRKVGSLRYCEAEVDAARERWERALSLGTERRDLERHLDALARELREATGLGPAASRVAVEIASAIEGGSLGGQTAREIETWLRHRERALATALEAEAGERAAEIRAEVDRDLEPYRQRMPARVLKQVQQDAFDRRLLEGHALRRLSLFDL